MDNIDRLKGFLENSKKKARWINPEEDEDPTKHQLDNLDSDSHPGSMFLADLRSKRVSIDAPLSKSEIDPIKHIVLTGLDDERIESLKKLLQMSEEPISLYLTRDMYRKLEEDMGDFDKVDEHIVKEDRDFDVDGINCLLSKVRGSTELRLRLKSGDEYHKGNWVTKASKRERIASLIHDEWVSWSKATADKVPHEKKVKWQKLWIPYEELTDDQKEKDREWADKVLAITNSLSKASMGLRDALTLIKERGVPLAPGFQPPGPPPRPGLEWKPETHRWIRPGDVSGTESPTTDYITEHDEMNEVLAELRGQQTIQSQDVGDEWGNETVGLLKENADAYLGQYEKFFDATTYNKARTAAYSIINTARGAKITATPKQLQELVNDSIDKLVYQEMRAWERQVSDHGIRHIVGNVINQDRISKALLIGGVQITPSDRFMMTIIAVNHDLGYTMHDARTSVEGTKKHKQYSKEWFDHEREQFKAYFTDDQLDLMSDIIAHHDSTDIDWENDPITTTVCVSDNLSLFHEDKLPSLYRYVDGALDSLYDMQEGLQKNDPNAVDKAKAKLYDDIERTKLPEYSKSWLRQAANEVSKYTAKYTLPMLIGNLTGFNYDLNAGLEVDINEDPFDDKIASYIDMGQTQYVKFAKDYGVDLKDNDDVEFKKEGKTLLHLKIKRHQIEKSMYGEYMIDMILKAGRPGLVPKKVMVERAGKSFLQTVYVKPGAEGEDIYKTFMNIHYNKFFGRRAKSTNEAIVAMNDEIDKQRIEKMGEETHYRAHELMSDWVEGMVVRVISLRMIAAATHGKEFTRDNVASYLKAFHSDVDDKNINAAYGIAKAMTYDMKPDPKAEGGIKVSMDPYIDILKKEKEFTEQKARDLFGDKITLYRGVYGPSAIEIKKQLKDHGQVEVEEFPFTSYSQDIWAAFAFVHDKGDYFVFKQEVPVTDIATAWFSNSAFAVSMPEQKEVVVDRKVQKITLKPEDVVIDDDKS